MKKILLIILLVFILSGCNNQSVNETNNTSIWNLIVNKEWSNFDNGFGSGFYFYEEDNIKYCTFKIYGSGLPTIYEYTTKVELDEKGVISLELPEKVKTGYLDEENEKSDKNINVKLKFTDGVIKLEDMEFKVYE